MWPFSRKETLPEIQEIQVQPLAEKYSDWSDLNPVLARASAKSVDINHLQMIQDADDQGGFFGQEFELRATAGRMKSLYSREPWVYATACLIARTLANIPMQVVNNSNDEVNETHEMNEVLARGGPEQDAFSQNWTGYTDLILGGNFFRAFTEDYNHHINVPVETANVKLRECGTDAQKIEAMEKGLAKELEVIRGTLTTTQCVEATYPWEQIVHHKLPNPFNPVYGLSMFIAATRPILLDRHKNEYEMAFYLRGGTHSGIVETTEDITRTRMDRLMRTYESAFTGKRNWFRQLFLPKGAKWVNSSLTQAEMQHLEGLRENRRTLLAVLGIPPSQIGIVEDVNRATAEVQERAFWEHTIIPLIKFVAAGWNDSYLIKEFYNDEVRIEPDLTGIEAIEGTVINRGEQAKAVERYLTINEIREDILGYPKLKNTDPRGNLFVTQIRPAMGDPFAAPTDPDPGDMGPEEVDKGMVQGNLSDGTGEYRHTHAAQWDPVTGNGTTLDTQGDGPAHNHQIVKFKPQPGGEDGHEHDPVVAMEDDLKAVRKKVATDNQQRLEKTQGHKFLAGFDGYINLLLDQSIFALRNDISIRSHLAGVKDEREQFYEKKVVPVLVDSMERGFSSASSQTKSVKQKATNFNETDSQAIDIIKGRTEDGKRRTMESRGIERFAGFDELQTEQINQIVEDGLSEGKTNEQIASDIRETHSEKYPGQSSVIARTEVLSAISEGIQWNHEVLGQVFSEVNKQWFHVGDAATNPDARQGHASFEKAGDDGVVPGDHVWVNPNTGAGLKFPRDPTAGAKDVINCRCTMVSVIPDDATSIAGQIINQ